MKPDISEFSYGYALTEELVMRSGLPIMAAPLFPSLIAEGQSGGGYDAHLQFAGFPLFLQFKLSHCMVRASAYECRMRLFTPNFYRIHLRPLKHSQQHNLLLDLESKGYPVYYAAPHFHLPEELNDAYLNSDVINRSAFFKPSDIGNLPDLEEHHISFKAGYPAYLFCEPRLISEESISRRTLDDDLLEGFYRYPIVDENGDGSEKVADDLLACVKKRVDDYAWLESKTISQLAEREPVQKIAYIARAFLGCEVLLVRPSETMQNGITNRSI
jgi:hypothetical protein